VGVSSMTTFGLHRADVLTARLIPPGTSSSDAVQLSMSILMRVINETFLIAGALCLLAVFSIIVLKNDST